MSDAEAKVGSLAWLDLTVADATAVRDFYVAVVGFGNSPVEMGGYSDYCLNLPGTDHAVVGVCHARGSNADLPPVWLPYFTVADLELSLTTCAARGGVLISGPHRMGQARYAVVHDPAGAACAPSEPAP